MSLIKDIVSKLGPAVSVAVLQACSGARCQEWSGCSHVTGNILSTAGTCCVFIVKTNVVQPLTAKIDFTFHVELIMD